MPEGDRQDGLARGVRWINAPLARLRYLLRHGLTDSAAATRCRGLRYLNVRKFHLSCFVSGAMLVAAAACSNTPSAAAPPEPKPASAAAAPVVEVLQLKTADGP